MKSLHFLLLLAITVVLFACKSDKKEQTPEVVSVETAPKQSTYESEKGDAEFKDEKLAAVYASYIEVKTALVNTNGKAAADAASGLMTAFANIGVEENVLAAAQSINDTDDTEAQRKAFVTVTEGVELLLEDALAEGTIYKQYCPMAFNNTGAYWLSNSKDIMNPYFGDKMLKCGRVASEIK